jgi:putative membrane protein
MMGLEWLKPAVFFGSVLYALIGVVVFWICFVIVDKLTPYDLWVEIIEKKNVALAIVVGSMCIAIGLIVAAAVIWAAGWYDMGSHIGGQDEDHA